MARYIDADKLCEALKSMASVQPTFKQSTILRVVSSIKNFPTADVVPKSEVENLELTLQGVMWSVDKWLDEKDYDADPIKRAITMREKTLQIVENAKSDVAREIFRDVKKAIKEEVRDYCRGFESMETPEMQEYYKTKQNTAIYLYMKIDHLEKKYTEGAAADGGKQ